MRTYILFIFCFLFSFLNFAQPIAVSPTQTPQQLVSNVLLGAGVFASNITINGVPGLANTPFGNIAYFTNANGTFPMTSGLVLTTGDAMGAMGPNNSGSNTLVGNSQDVSSDPDLSAIANGNITNGVILEFDFIPAGDTLIFNYMFGSDEYLEFAPPNNSSFNDAFGIFLWGPGISGPFPLAGYPNGGDNIATIPGGTPVTINNVNPVTNPQYYVYNEAPQDTYLDAIQYDGTTVKLTASASVQCNQTYHIKFAIANVLDQAWDSGVFLEAGSFSSAAVSVAVATVSGDTTIVEGCTFADFIFTRPEGQTNDTLIINYTVTGSAIEGVDYNNLVNPIVFLPGQDTVILNLTPTQDGLNEGFESVTISVSIINPCGDTITSEGTIYIGDGPIINISETDPLVQCYPDSVLLTASAFGGYAPYDFTWTTLTGTVLSTNDSLTINVTQNGVVQYLITAVDQCNFSQTDTATVTVNQTIAIDAINMTEATCIPSGTLSAVVSGTTGNVNYSWSNGQQGQSIQNLSGGWYTLTITDQVCSASDSVFVGTIASPIADFTATPAGGCSPLNVVFVNNSANGNGYAWNYGNGQGVVVQTTDPQSSQYVTQTPEDYTVTLVVSQGINCVDSMSITIPVDVCDCADPEALNYNSSANVNVLSNCIYPYPEVEAPNVITPDGDLTNDVFFLQYKNVVTIELIIFNRWGAIMYSGSSSDLTQSQPSWDGKSNGNESSEGVYTYTYKATGVSGGEVSGHGFFHLIR
ncbi:MAG: choice-of-anchor L domain-containing protein [Crocinitomicaceae bacterium]|jgi:gliding motility-associated-like protein|nr:choice-of-anchor L domain-containing protein [Crocinitomicaceae bacterium]